MAPQIGVKDGEKDDKKALSLAQAVRDGSLSEDAGRRELFMLALASEVLEESVRYQALAPTAHARQDMYDKMVDLIERKVVDINPDTKHLELDLLLEGTSFTGWLRQLLFGSGKFLRQRILRDQRDHLKLVRRAHEDFMSANPDLLAPDASQAALSSEPADSVPLVTTSGDELQRDLLRDGTETALRAAAFRSTGSAYRGSRRILTQALLLAETFNVSTLPHLPLDDLVMRDQILTWCQENSDGARLRAMLNDLVAGRWTANDPVEEVVMALFGELTVQESAILATKPGYTLVHLVHAAVAPIPVPLSKDVKAMIGVVSKITGKTTRSARLVRRWAAAHAELTGSENDTRTKAPAVKSVKDHRTDVDLFETDATDFIESPNLSLGATPAAIGAFLEDLHARLSSEPLTTAGDRLLSNVTILKNHRSA